MPHPPTPTSQLPPAACLMEVHHLEGGERKGGGEGGERKGGGEGKGEDGRRGGKGRGREEGRGGGGGGKDITQLGHTH